MFLENVSGLAERILRNFDLSPRDTALVISSSGCNLVPIEMAAEFRKRGLKVVAIISRKHSEATPSRHPDGKKLQDFANLTLDTGAPVGDAMVKIPGLETPVAPGSTVGGCMLVNAIKAEVAELLARRKATQPTNKRTFGSVFKNPAAGPGAGALIERAGLKGHRIGGATISERHANFIENAGDARTRDALALMTEARRRAFEQYGVELRHEVEFLGDLALEPIR